MALFLAIVWMGITGAAGATAEPAGVPVELSVELLDHWVQAMRSIGTDSLDSPSHSPIRQQTDPGRLDRICSAAGFISPEQCGCTVLYAAVLMQGFDSDRKTFIDPVTAIQHRIAALLKRSKVSGPGNAVDQALARDRRMVLALTRALPNGVPPAHLVLMDRYLREQLAPDVKVWQQLAAGMKAIETSAIGNRCTKLPAITAPTR